MKNNSKKHWIVVGICCCLAASSLGLQNNVAGVYYTPVSEALNIGRGTFAFHMTLFTLMVALVALITPAIMARVPYKLLLIVGGSINIAATAAMGLVSTPIAFNILGIIRGISIGTFFGVPITMIINSWFEEKLGFATSLAFSFSGVAGAIASPILTSLIASVGWRTTYFINAALCGVLILPAILYNWHFNPRQDGLLPYGFKDLDNLHGAKKEEVFIPKTNFLSVAFILTFVFAVLGAGLTSFVQHFPGYASSLDMVTVGATMLSIAMIGNIVFKFLAGTLADMIGIVKSTLVVTLFSVVGILLIIFGRSPILLIIGSLAFGSTYALGSVCLPLIVRTFFGENNYNTVFPIMNCSSSIGCSIIITLVGMIYDASGSYTVALILAVIMAVAVIASLLGAKATNPVDQAKKGETQNA